MAEPGFSNFTNGDYFAWYLGAANNGNQNLHGILQIQMDIVGFLAVLGEGSVLSNSQVASLSWLTFLPRLMPAPQALLRPTRPDGLETHTGFTTAVSAGNHRSHINHVGHVVVDAERSPAFSVRCVRIHRRFRTGSKVLTEDKRVKTAAVDKTHRLHERHGSTTEHSLTAKTWGPLGLVAIAGFIFSVVLFAFSIARQDGCALIATIIFSFLSTLVGYSGKWRLNLQKRVNTSRRVPPGDVVIRYPKGNFLIVSCDEDVARELFFAPENIMYLVENQWQYRIISLIGTILLMFGVIFLANASTWMQIGFAIAYITMNALYWMVAALPSKIHWDASCFKVSDQCIELKPPSLTEGDPSGESGEPAEKGESVDRLPKPSSGGYKGKSAKFVDNNRTFTSGLWKAILVTQSTDWVRLSGAAPDTPAWQEWLTEAKMMAGTLGTETTYQHKFKSEENATLVYRLPEWDAQKALMKCLEKHSGADLEKNEPESNRQATIEAIEGESKDC